WHEAVFWSQFCPQQETKDGQGSYRRFRQASQGCREGRRWKNDRRRQAEGGRRGRQDEGQDSERHRRREGRHTRRRKVALADAFAEGPGRFRALSFARAPPFTARVPGTAA